MTQIHGRRCCSKNLAVVLFVAFVFKHVRSCSADFPAQPKSLLTPSSGITKVSKRKLRKQLIRSNLKSESQRAEGAPAPLPYPDEISRKETKFSPSSTVSVEAFLVPRKVSLRFFLRGFFFSCVVVSLLQCIRTSGVPFSNSVWQIVYGDPEFVGSSSSPSAPQKYMPSPADICLAKLIASSIKNVQILLPPTGLPSTGPILGLIASLFLYIGLTHLLPLWSTKFRVFLDYCRLQSLETPTRINSRNSHKSQRQRCLECVLVRGQKFTKTSQSALDRQTTLVCPLYAATKYQNPTGNNTEIDISLNKSFVHPSAYYFEVDQSRVYCIPRSNVCIDGSPNLQDSTLDSLQRLVNDGGLTKQQRSVAEDRYGMYNTFVLATPTIEEAFLARVSSPLVVIQLMGNLMTLIEEGRRAFIALTFSLIEHYAHSKQVIQAAKQMAQEVKSNLQDTSELQVLVWKREQAEWVPSVARSLIPGDIFRLWRDSSQEKNETGSEDLIVPVDALVIKGQCLTNEAVLTGESIPLVKTAFEFQEVLENQAHTVVGTERGGFRKLDFIKDRSSILFAGTTLLRDGLSSQGEHNFTGLTCLTLRTGSYSSKGQLLRAMQSNKHVGAISNAQSEKDALRLIAVLSAFAITSCASLFVRTNVNGVTVSPFRRIVQCTRIILAGIPSSLPMALGAVARSCSRILRIQSDVACSEPGSLLTAAHVDTVVFDKTGTITADTQSLSKLVSSTISPEITDAFQRCILAGCHSLVPRYNAGAGTYSFVGDPLDDASLRFSGWKYNQTNGSFFDPLATSASVGADDAVRLWQIKTFPFDPSRRLSSSIVLVEKKNSKLEVWRLTKGSPETVNQMLAITSDVNKRRKLEMEGYRIIALCAENLAESTLSSLLFPNGLSADIESLIAARSRAEKLHRNDVESNGRLVDCGLSCFNASLRSSSRRIIRELKRAGIVCVMLTGDSMEASLNVAEKAGFLETKRVAILEKLPDQAVGDAIVVWKLLEFQIGEDRSLDAVHIGSKFEPLTIKTLRKLLKLQAKGKLSLAASGDALECLLRDTSSNAYRFAIRNLTVIARATPEVKHSVVDTLRRSCGKIVMMCGDGVNDVAAIQAADVATALLNGFGAEEDSNLDLDDLRRAKMVRSMKLGRNRASSTANNGSRERIGKQIRKTIKEIDERVGKRQDSASNRSMLRYTLNDVKDIAIASLQAYREERKRSKILRKGGGDAARILAEERKSEVASQESSQHEEQENSMTTPIIKPGEVSLVSPFSCLHPSIDGVDAVLRAAVATAAAALATEQSVALHSLLSCFHLATLYRDGVKYSEKMYVFEILLGVLLDSLRYQASCTPRPRLPSSVLCRPDVSLFDCGSIVMTLFQAVAHLLFMSWGVSFAKTLESAPQIGEQRVLGISPRTHYGRRLQNLLKILCTSPLPDNNKSGSLSSFFRPAPFRPNYQTNMVFLFSVLQTAVSTVVSHRGRPFNRSFLESQDFCRVFCVSILFFVVCVAGTMPGLTLLLSVKPFPTLRSKLVVIGIGMANLLACVSSRWITNRFLATLQMSDTINDALNDKNTEGHQVTADLEEELLLEEAQLNLQEIKIFVGVLIYLLVDMIADGLKVDYRQLKVAV